MAKIAELEKQLSHARKELETLRVRLGTRAEWRGGPRRRRRVPSHPQTTPLDWVSKLDPFLQPGRRKGWRSAKGHRCALTSLPSPGALRCVRLSGCLQASPGA